MRVFLQQLLRDKPLEFYLVFFVMWLVPALCLFGLGVLYLYQAGWLWWFSLGMLALTLLTLLIRYILASESVDEESPLPHLEAIDDWSGRDVDAWQKALAHIDSANLAATPWEELPAAMLDQLSCVARIYRIDKNAEYAFSLPELLLMLETFSREYRAVVMANVPLSQDLKISTLRNVADKTGSITKAYRYVAPLISVARLFWNPASGITSEIRSRIVSEVMGGLSVQMQKNLRQTLFEQISQIAIELYSGRLKLSEQELLAYRNNQQLPEEMTTKPLTVIIVGQVNAGKSSLLNALKQRCLAEVDVLPATQGFYFYHMLMSNEEDIYLIDTPGLDGDKKNRKALLQQAVQADLVLWVSQANQPAKALDKQLLDDWLEYFEQNLSRKRPPILLVSTHNDLLPPKDEWRPPYDLEDRNNNKSVTIMQALEYTQQAIGLPAGGLALPVCLAPSEHIWNIDVLQTLLVSLSGDARAAQLNKDRLQGADDAVLVRRALSQTIGLVKLGYGLLVK